MYKLEKEVATHSSILAWKIPWTEEPGRLQFMGSQRVGHNWATSLSYVNMTQAVSRIYKESVPIRKRDTTQLLNYTKDLNTSQVSSVTQSYPALCDHMDCSTPGFPVRHKLPELIQTHIHQVSDAIQPSHPLSSPSPPAFSLFQHQGLFQWVSSSHHVAIVLEFQLQHQSFQWMFRTYFL